MRLSVDILRPVDVCPQHRLAAAARASVGEHGEHMALLGTDGYGTEEFSISIKLASSAWPVRFTPIADNVVALRHHDVDVDQ